MTVLKEKGSHGAFVQYFAAAPHTKLVFSADVESDQPGIAYLNVKLNKDKQEFASLNSPTAPGGRQRLELFFDTGDADAMAVLCRVQPMAGAVGKNVVFSNLALIFAVGVAVGSAAALVVTRKDGAVTGAPSTAMSGA